MTADSGYISCRFDGPEDTLSRFRTLADSTDRQALFSCGLSWLDELDGQFQAESEAVSYDTLELTREFLLRAAEALPQLTFEGTLEHGWPVLPARRTAVTFSGEGGALCWDERQVDDGPEEPFPLPEWEDDADPDEIEVPLTPY